MTDEERSKRILATARPGDKMAWIVGMPGPDYDDMEIVEVVGQQLRIKYQVWGEGPFHETLISPSIVAWKKDSDFGRRFAEFKP